MNGGTGAEYLEARQWTRLRIRSCHLEVTLSESVRVETLLLTVMATVSAQREHLAVHDVHVAVCLQKSAPSQRFLIFWINML